MYLSKQMDQALNNQEIQEKQGWSNIFFFHDCAYTGTENVFCYWNMAPLGRNVIFTSHHTVILVVWEETTLPPFDSVLTIENLPHEVKI